MKAQLVNAVAGFCISQAVKILKKGRHPFPFRVYVACVAVTNEVLSSNISSAEINGIMLPCGACLLYLKNKGDSPILALYSTVNS